MRDLIERLFTTACVVAVILFTGYMCGAPIIAQNPENLMPYLMALGMGGLAFFRPWRY